MEVTISYHPRILRSLRNEASRQAMFFESRDSEVSSWWTNVEAAAHQALSQRTGLRLILIHSIDKDSLIKPCE